MKIALNTGHTVSELILKAGLLKENEINNILDIVSMAELGTSAKQLMLG